jgi:hypothetical protein
MKPNIFSLATKELSQDSFFTWLLQWADHSNSQYDLQLNETAKDFIRLLIGQPADYQITKVEAGRQWNNIDIWAEINDEYFICIEDKTNTGEHSEQLERYKQIVQEHYKEKNLKLVFIYLKTGNESLTTLNLIIEKGYTIIDRKAILNVFNQRQVNNAIFVEFKEYLTAIENQTNSFTLYENLISDWRASEGFFLKLQEINLQNYSTEKITNWVSQIGDWRYVSNPNGGFLGFWYHWICLQWNDGEEECCINIQIENSFKPNYGGIKLVLKVSEWEPSTNLLHKLFEEIEPFAKNNGLSIVKPDRYRPGETSTLAVIENAFTVDKEGNFEFEKFIKTLKALEKTLDEYSEKYK